MTTAEFLGVGTEVEIDGEPLVLRKPTIAEEAAFAEWVKARAKREAATPDPTAPPDVAERVADRLTRSVMRDIGEGYYEPPAGPGYVAAYQRPDGVAELLYLMLRTDKPGITREKVRGLVEAGLVRAWAKVIELEKKTPEVRAAVLEFLGLPPTWLDSSPGAAATSPGSTDTAPGKSAG